MTGSVYTRDSSADRGRRVADDFSSGSGSGGGEYPDTRIVIGKTRTVSSRLSLGNPVSCSKVKMVHLIGGGSTVRKLTLWTLGATTTIMFRFIQDIEKKGLTQ